MGRDTSRRDVIAQWNMLYDMYERRLKAELS